MTNLNRAIKRYGESPLPLQVLMDVLAEYKRPHDKISEMVKSGQLTMVRKGLYIPGPELDVAPPHPFLTANHLYGPSYISLQSALAFHGMIPERTYGVSSVSMKRSTQYETAAGAFSYTRVPMPYYSFGITSQVLTEKQVVLMASPEKAVCDIIITSSGVNLRSVAQTKAFLFDDLRLDENKVSDLQLAEIASWTEHSPKSKSLQMLVKTLSA